MSPSVLSLSALVAVAAPLVGAALVSTPSGERSPRSIAVAASATALVAGLLLALGFGEGATPLALGPTLGGGRLLFVDGLSAVLLPFAALVSTAIALVAPRRALDRSAVRRSLAGSGATAALFVTSHPWTLLTLWVVTAWLTWRATRVTPGAGPAARVYAIYMGLATAAMIAGTAMLVADPPWERASGVVGTAGGWLVALAVMIRKGICPFHSWYPALFSGAPMSTALLATMPQVAAYAAVRLLVGHADGVARELETLTVLALVTAVYGAALALVQRDLRGFIGVLAMSQSALVLAGLSGRLPMELNGAFCLWISSGLAITGIGLVSWAIESRAGPIPLETLQGRFWDAPALAAFFLLFGMAAIGLPGTLSFVADDLIVSGSLDDHLVAGLLVIASTVLCGIAVMRCWFHVFGGQQPVDSPRHGILPREQASLCVLLAALFGLGVWPGPLVQALERAAGRRRFRAPCPPTRKPHTMITLPMAALQCHVPALVAVFSADQIGRVVESLERNLLTPIPLCFVLGLICTQIHGGIKIPKELYLSIAIFLLMSIGFIGGHELAHEYQEHGISTIWKPALATLVLGCVTPITSYLVLRYLCGFTIADSAGIAAHYGSTSAVTYAVANSFVEQTQHPANSFLPTLVTILECPGIAIALVLGAALSARERAAKAQASGKPVRESKLGEALYEVMTGQSIMLMAGLLVIGFVSTLFMDPKGFQPFYDFFQSKGMLFRGALCIFLLEMGLVAGERLGDLKKVGPALVAFGILMPLVHGFFGVWLGHLAGLNLGGCTVLGAIVASASYIAAPPAVRLTLPEANPTLSITAALAITFPFNIALGIPIYFEMAKWVGAT